MLKTQDLYLFSKLLRKMDLKQDIKLALKHKDKKEIGIEIMMLVIERLDLANEEINKLLSNFTGKNIKEIENQSLVITINEIKSLFDNKEFADFFKSAMQ